MYSFTPVMKRIACRSSTTAGRPRLAHWPARDFDLLESRNRVGRLDPAVLFRVAFDGVSSDKIEDEVGAAGGKVDQPFAPLRAQPGDQIVRVDLCEIRHDETGIAAAGAQGNRLGLEHDDGKALLRGMKRGREAGKPAADNGKIGIKRFGECRPVLAVAAERLPEGNALACSWRGAALIGDGLRSLPCQGVCGEAGRRRGRSDGPRG